MTLERVVIAVVVFIGILMCVLAVVAGIYWGLSLPFAIFLFIGGVILIIITIIVYFIIL